MTTATGICNKLPAGEGLGVGVEVVWEVGLEVEVVETLLGAEVGVGVKVGVKVAVGMGVAVGEGMGVGVRQSVVSKLQAISQDRVPASKPRVVQLWLFKSTPSQSSPPSIIPLPQTLILTVALTLLVKLAWVYFASNKNSVINTKKTALDRKNNFFFNHFYLYLIYSLK